MRRRLIPSRVRKLLTVWAPTRKSLEQWSDDFKQGHTVTRVNLENDDAFSFFVEPSFSGNDVVLDKARNDDEDDVGENMNHHFLDVTRTSFMTCHKKMKRPQRVPPPPRDGSKFCFFQRSVVGNLEAIEAKKIQILSTREKKKKKKKKEEK